MKLYHGSNRSFAVVDLSKSNDKRDFGKGFYTTTLKDQAVDWAETVFTRYGGEGKLVYEFDFEASSDLSVKTFESANEEWLEFIADSRGRGGLRHNFDVVTGPVANDKTNREKALSYLTLIKREQYVH